LGGIRGDGKCDIDEIDLWIITPPSL
jgi:hypothetical protein